MIPPRKDRPWPIDRPMPDKEPGQSQFRLPRQLPRRPFGREPQLCDDDRENDDDLANQQPGRGHGLAPGRTVRPDRARLSRARSEEHTSELQSLMRNSYAVSGLK